MLDIQRNILIALRDGPLDQFQIAADLCEPPFRIRGELQALRREKKVRQQLRERAILWELTEQGTALAWAGEQLKLTTQEQAK